MSTITFGGTSSKGTNSGFQTKSMKNKKKKGGGAGGVVHADAYTAYQPPQKNCAWQVGRWVGRWVGR